MKNVLITGIAGGRGQLVARKLLRRQQGYRICGVDRSPWEGRPHGVRVTITDVRKRRFEDVIRRERPDAIVHLASIRHFKVHPAVRHEVNVNGTRRLIDFSVSHGVKQVVVFSSSYVYGALPENPYYMDESFPLNASRTYPEMRDLAEMDTLASAYLWKYPEVAVCILRPVNALGYHVHNAIGRYLQREYVPTVLGFNPMMQFIHEEDVAEAIVRSIECDLRGIFNVVGPGAVPLHVAVREVGGTAVPLPEAVARGAVQRRFRSATGFEPRFSLAETFAAVRA